MQERNVDLDIPLRREQWEQIARTAQAIRASGYDWKGTEPDTLRIFLKDEEARGIWERIVSDENQYGANQVEIAQILFNDGRPFAHLVAIPAFDEPVVTSQQEAAVEVGQERFVREKWHHLLEQSGLHFERGHTSPEVG